MLLGYQLSHILDNSWLPLGMSMSSFLIFLLLLLWFKLGFGSFLLLGVFIPFGFFLWFRDTIRESTFQGNHSSLVMSGLKWGLVWFLFSEVWFFFSIFWSFFHMSLSPLTSGFNMWPYLGLEIIPPFQVPLLNTLILLMSGVTATLAHHQVLQGTLSSWLGISAILGFYFLMLQGWEYYFASITLASSVLGSVFFMGTGFHGLHVCLGMMMLFTSAARLSQWSYKHHFGLEFSLWYWHFVDVVWLFLFMWVYWWNALY